MKATWTEKYMIAMNESLTVKGIMKLRDVGQPTALKIRQKAIEYCIRNNIQVNGQKVPTIAVMEVTKCDLDYYYNQMLREAEVNKLLKGGELTHVSA